MTRTHLTPVQKIRCPASRIRGSAAFTFPDLLACIIVAVMLVAVIQVTSCAETPAGGEHAQSSDDGRAAPENGGEADVDPRIAMRMKDADQLRQIHQAMVTLSEQQGGRYPTPGLTRRAPQNGKAIPGMGAEDPTQNTTANLYSLMVMQQATPAEILISPLERNPVVSAVEDYNFDVHSPQHSVYWDPSFAADLTSASNTSYAHLVLHGGRIRRGWRATMDASYPVLGNRGPRDGKPDPDSFTTDDAGQWAGHLATNDGSVEWYDTMAPPAMVFTHDGEVMADNVFAVQSGWDGSDRILSFTLENGGDAPVIQHD